MNIWQGMIICMEGSWLCAQAFAIFKQLLEIKMELKKDRKR